MGCSNCKHWSEVPVDDLSKHVGICRVGPPTPVMKPDASYDSVWPMTFGHDSCGQFAMADFLRDIEGTGFGADE